MTTPSTYPAKLRAVAHLLEQMPSLGDDVHVTPTNLTIHLDQRVEWRPTVDDLVARFGHATDARPLYGVRALALKFDGDDVHGPFSVFVPLWRGRPVEQDQTDVSTYLAPVEATP